MLSTALFRSYGGDFCCYNVEILMLSFILYLTKGYRMVVRDFARLRDPGFKFRDRNLSVFVNSEHETLLLKIPSPETLSAENLQWYKI